MAEEGGDQKVVRPAAKIGSVLPPSEKEVSPVPASFGATDDAENATRGRQTVADCNIIVAGITKLFTINNPLSRAARGPLAGRGPLTIPASPLPSPPSVAARNVFCARNTRVRGVSRRREPRYVATSEKRFDIERSPMGNSTRIMVFKRGR